MKIKNSKSLVWIKKNFKRFYLNWIFNILPCVESLRALVPMKETKVKCSVFSCTIL
jgi:hypothetical protein